MGAAPELAGQKVRLRPFGPDDITPAYVSWLNDPEVTRFSNQRFRRHDHASCTAYLAGFEGTANLFLAITPINGQNAVGTMTAYVSSHHGCVDIGIMLGDRGMWGRGYGQDAFSTLVDWFSRQSHIRKITAGCVDANQVMRRLMERAGMEHEATRKAQEVIEGVPHDLVYYARFTGR